MINMSYLDEILEGRLPTSDSSFVLKGEDGQIMVQQGVELEENKLGTDDCFDPGNPYRVFPIIYGCNHCV